MMLVASVVTTVKGYAEVGRCFQANGRREVKIKSVKFDVHFGLDMETEA